MGDKQDYHLKLPHTIIMPTPSSTALLDTRSTLHEVEHPKAHSTYTESLGKLQTNDMCNTIDFLHPELEKILAGKERSWYHKRHTAAKTKTHPELKKRDIAMNIHFGCFDDDQIECIAKRLVQIFQRKISAQDAYASSLRLGNYPCHLRLNCRKIRQYLWKCISAGTFTPCPSSRCSTEGAPINIQINVYCSCHRPHENNQSMAECSQCSKWFHPSCDGIPEEVFQNNHEWLCNSCTRVLVHSSVRNRH